MNIYIPNTTTFTVYHDSPSMTLVVQRHIPNSLLSKRERRLIRNSDRPQAMVADILSHLNLEWEGFGPWVTWDVDMNSGQHYKYQMQEMLVVVGYDTLCIGEQIAALI